MPNIGIGTTAPQSKLDVNGVVTIGGTSYETGNLLLVKDGNSNYTPSSAGAFVPDAAMNIGNSWSSATNTALISLYVNGNATNKFGYLGALSGSIDHVPALVFGASTGANSYQESMRIISGNVGIGTTAPTSRLHVSGTLRIGNGGELCSVVGAGGLRYNGGALELCDGTSWAAAGGSGDFKADGTVAMTGALRAIAGTASAPGMAFVGDTNTGFSSPAADRLAISTGGSARLTVTTDKGIFIGDEPSFFTAFSINNGTPSMSIKDTNSSGVDRIGYIDFRGDDGVQRALIGDNDPVSNMMTFTSFDSGIRLKAATSQPITLEQNSIERIRVHTDGNVGIGTTAPTTKLQVDGTIRVGDGGETCSGGNFTGGIRYNGGNLQFCNGTAWTTLGTGGGGGLPAADGSAAAPTINFTNSATTGFYRASAGVIGVSAAGNSVATISATTFNAGGLDFSSNSVTTNAVTSNGTVVAAGNIISTGGRMVAGVSTDADALSAITVTFANSNMVRVTTSPAAACGTLNVTNTTAGGSFTVTILNANATCSTINWNGAPTNVKLPTGYAGGVAANGLVYTFIDDGATLWVSYVPF